MTAAYAVDYPPIVLGVDPSITGCGLALAGPAGIETHLAATRGVPGDDRLIAIYAALADVLGDGVGLAVVEDLPTHAHGAGITGMVQGIVRLALLLAEVPYVLVPPASLKVYATGKGNATKADMRMALYKRTGLDLADDNRVDAWWLAAMGTEHLGDPAVIDMPAGHRKALASVRWPAMPVRTVRAAGGRL